MQGLQLGPFSVQARNSSSRGRLVEADLSGAGQTGGNEPFQPSSLLGAMGSSEDNRSLKPKGGARGEMCG